MDKIGTEHTGGQVDSRGIYVGVEPFTGKDRFQLLYIQTTEVICGDLVYGSAGMITTNIEEMEDAFKEQNAIHIIISQESVGLEYHLWGWITDKNFDHGTGGFTFDFVCAPKAGETVVDQEFFTTPRTRHFYDASLEDVMNAVYPDKAEGIRWYTDGTNLPVMDWHQDKETDHAFLCRVAWCYREKTIFGFDYDGMFIKDIVWKDRVTGKDEPSRWVDITGSAIPMEAVGMGYRWPSYLPIENPCTDGEEAPGVEISKTTDLETMGSQLRFVRNGYRQATKNQRYNQRLVGNGFFSKATYMSTNTIPNLRPGDTVEYVRGDMETKSKGPSGPMTWFTVIQVRFFYSTSGEHMDEYGNTMSVVYTLGGIQDFYGNLLPDQPEQDPGKQKNDISL